MKKCLLQQPIKPNRVLPVAGAVVSLCLSLTSNAALACSATVSTPISVSNSAPCELLTGESITITSNGTITSTTDVNGNNEKAISANGLATTVTNNGTISGYIDVSGAGNGITSITNTGNITGISAIKVSNGGTLSFISNTGSPLIPATMIGTSQAAIWVASAIGNINNGADSNIIGASGGDGIYVLGSVNNITNAGRIFGFSGVNLNTTGTVNAITNSGLIGATDANGIALHSPGNSTFTLNNSDGGEIFGVDPNHAGVYIDTTINSIDNHFGGSISGRSGAVGIYVGGSINTVTNAGMISGSTGIDINTAGFVNTITNSGVIEGTDASGITLLNLGNSTFTLSNSNGGAILGFGSNNAGVYIDTLVNSISNDANSNIEGTSGADGVYVGGSINSIANAGTISGSTGIEISSSGSINTIDNAATGVISGDLAAIRADSGGSVGSITNAGTIAGVNGTAIDLSLAQNATSITNTGTINGSVLLGSGTLNLNGTSGAVNGGVIGTSGSAVNVNGTYVSGGNYSVGNFSIASGSALDLRHTLSSTNAVINAGTLNMNPGGDISGAIAGGGTLNINTNFSTQGNVSASLLALATGRTLNVAHPVTASGAISNAGTLNVAAGQTVNAGSYSQSASGVLSVGASSATNHGKVVVVGAADFSASGAIAVNVSPGSTLIHNDVLHIVTAGSLSSPSTYNVTDNNALWTFTAADNGSNGIDLTAHYSSLTTAIQAANQPLASGVAEALNMILTGTIPSSMQGLASGLNAQSNPVSLGNQVAQLIPVLSGGQGVAALASINAGASSLVQTQLTTSLGLSSGDAMAYQHVWIKPFGATLKQDAASSGMPGYKAATSGLAVGTDRKLEVYGLRAGFALSYGSTKVEDAGFNAGSLDISSFQLTGYGINRISDRLQLNLVGALGLNSNKSSRYVPLVTTNYTGQYNSWNTLLDAQLEWAYKVSNKTAINPSIRLSYSALRSDAYTETPSGNAALNVASTTTDSLVFGIGAKWVYGLNSQSRWIGHVEVGNDLVDKPSAVTSSFEGGGPSFTTSGTAPSRTVIKTGLAYKQTSTNGMEVTARFDIESRPQFMGNSLSLNWRRPF